MYFEEHERDNPYSVERQWESEMSRISRNALLRAIQAVQEMNNEQNCIGRRDILPQPNMLGSVLVLPRLGVSAAEQEFVLEILFLCFGRRRNRA